MVELMSYDKSKHTQKPQPTKKIYSPLEEESYVARAEKVINDLQSNRGRYEPQLTTSQIRNILSMLNEIYNEVTASPDETLSSAVQNRLRYLKIKLIYAAGRNRAVKKFMEASQIDQHLDHIGDSREKFILYSHYMEALVAYHRFHGGKD